MTSTSREQCCCCAAAAAAGEAQINCANPRPLNAPELQAMDPAAKENIIEILNRAFSQRYHSVAQYMLDSCPYIEEGDAPLVDVIREIAAFDQREAERLAEIIESLEGIPMVMPYSHEVAELNYLSLRYLKGALKAYLEKELLDIDRNLPGAQCIPQAFAALDRLRGAIQSQIGQLASV